MYHFDFISLRTCITLISFPLGHASLLYHFQQDMHQFMSALQKSLGVLYGAEFKDELLNVWSIWCKALEDTFIIGMEKA